MLTDIHVCVTVVQEVARRSVTKTQVEVENGDEEEEVVQTVSVFLARLTIKQPTRLMWKYFPPFTFFSYFFKFIVGFFVACSQ